METVNDLDGDLGCFWRVLREHPDELARACALTPHSRAELDRCYDREGCDDLERARRVFVQFTQGRGGVGVRSGWRHYVKPTGRCGMPAYLAGYVDRMAAAAERLQQVSLECRPAGEVIASYGSEPEVLLYVDPPYLGTTRGGGGRRYHHEMLGADEHTDLLAALLDCRAAVVLSGYPSALYDDALSGWRRHTFKSDTGQSAQGEWSVRTEVLWSNRQLGAQVPLF